MEETVMDVAPPEDQMTDFGRATTLLMDSYEKDKGRTFGKAQVEALAEGLLEMAATIQMGIGYTEKIEAELEQLKGKKRIWQPNK